MRPSRSASEFSRLWRAPQLAGVELFAADFFRFEFDRHSHSQLAVGLIERGAEGLHYRGKKIVVPAGSMIIIEPGEIHTGFAACDSGYQYRMFYFDTALVSSVAREMTSHGTINFRHSIVYDPPCFELFLQLHKCLDDTDTLAADTLTAQSMTVDALYYLLNQHGAVARKTTLEDTSALTQAADYLLDNIGEKVSIEELCRLINRSRVTLINGFKHRYGLPPHAWLLRARTERAKELLLAGTKPSEVAHLLGYSDQAHMSRLMKRYFGVTPGALRP